MRLYVAVIFALVALASAHEDKYERMLKKWVKCKAMEGCFGEENTKMWIMKMKKAKAKCSGKPAPELHLPIFQKKVRVTNAFMAQNQDDFIDEKMRQQFVAKLMAAEMGGMAKDDAMPYALNKFAMSRYARDADDEDETEMDIADLGDMMVEKLSHMEDKMEAEIGNMTCCMQEMGFINQKMEIDVESMDKCLDEGKFKPEESADGVDRTWLQAKLKNVHQMCKDLSDSLPESILNACSLPQWMTRVKFFHKCAKFHKVETCMQSDIRHKVGSKGIEIENLAEKAGMTGEEITGLLAMMYFKH